MPSTTVNRLIALATRLRNETADFLDSPGDGQAWYNRGYGGGILRALRELGHGAALDEHCADDPDQVLAPHRPMAWGRAYEHGREKGWSDTRQVLEECSSGASSGN